MQTNRISTLHPINYCLLYTSYFKLMKWMEKEKPEVYKEAMEHILKELGKLKMEE